MRVLVCGGRGLYGPEELRKASAWAERRPPRTEAERAEVANSASAHLPQSARISISDADMMALKLAFIRRFDEDLPRTETLMAVAAIGYRMALRDLQTEGL